MKHSEWKNRTLKSTNMLTIVGKVLFIVKLDDGCSVNQILYTEIELILANSCIDVFWWKFLDRITFQIFLQYSDSVTLNDNSVTLFDIVAQLFYYV